MISSNIAGKLNEQLNYELYSSYIYLSMSSKLTSSGYKGFASWFQIQAQEELVHAMGFYYFLLDRGGEAVMKAVKAPPYGWKSALDAFETAYKHECGVTVRINDISTAAGNEKDLATVNFLQWYIGEQVEEEANALEIVNELKLAGSSKEALFMLDREKGARTFVMPVIPGGMKPPAAAPQA